eukprot:3273103-Amphidinium_carterae.3
MPRHIELSTFAHSVHSRRVPNAAPSHQTSNSFTLRVTQTSSKIHHRFIALSSAPDSIGTSAASGSAIVTGYVGGAHLATALCLIPQLHSDAQVELLAYTFDVAMATEASYPSTSLAAYLRHMSVCLLDRATARQSKILRVLIRENSHALRDCHIHLGPSS